MWPATFSERGHRRRGAVALVMVVLAAGPGCGRKAPPTPPQILVAAPTRDLTVEQRGGVAVLTWSYPAVTAAGAPLPDVEAVEVWRAALPQGQEPTGSSPRDLAVKVQLLESQGAVLATLDPAALAAATRGPKLVVEDDLTTIQVTADDAEPVIWYAVRTICCGDRTSDFSPVARLVRTPPPDPPGGLAASGAEGGVRLTWAAVEGVAAAVERSADGTTWEEVTAEPVAAAEWLAAGAAQGRSWSYRLRGVATTAGGTRLVGEAGPVVTVDHPDLYPPTALENLVCLPEEGVVRLRWTLPSSDVRVRVERTVGSGTTIVVASGLTIQEAVDEHPPAGPLTYSVVAVDVAGNVSAAATCSTVMGTEP